MKARMAAEAIDMLTLIQQRVVWERWFQSEVRALYYADLASLYRRKQTWITWTSLFASSGALAAIVFALASHRWPWLPAVLALIPTGLSLYSLAATPQQKAAEATELQLRWHAFAQEHRRLWDAMYSEDASRHFAELDAVARELSALSNRLPYEPQRMDKWWEVVAEQHRAAMPHAA